MDDEIEAIDLSALTTSGSADPFEVIAELDPTSLSSLAADSARRELVATASLRPAAPPGDRHIGTGTNFPEHAEEAASVSVFQFPKFGAAQGPTTKVTFQPDIMLDYEVELCLRFDRTVASIEDFDAAKKGFFLCGDFTDRSTLVRMVDPDNLDSGSGFSDSKSRADFYPAGPLLVIPSDWRQFVADQRMTTEVNGVSRQDARGREMILDFRELTEKALADMSERRFRYHERYVRLTPSPKITPDMTLMSGTAEGVIFTPPTRGDIIEGLWHWLTSAEWLKGTSPIDAVKERFISNELASGHFLQPGDTVRHRSSTLGEIVVTVVN
jgi:2-keto-4-pentenoate hydratase/2-oxohepta-3-ene-1,7-dioic acid hydratase in catechol pathway